jgi:serine/threonine protein kinase
MVPHPSAKTAETKRTRTRFHRIACMLADWRPYGARAATHVRGCRGVDGQARIRTRRGLEMIGEVFGNYRIIAKLGEGGMGAVYLAEHPSIGRKVAVKMIRPAFSNDAETLRRFVREARSTATLRHPALVEIMDYGVHEKTGGAYIIMEYLEGESLDARLEREGRLEPGRAAHIARQIALGMAAAHRAGIIHRDLKPANVHLGVDPDRPGVDVVKVLDFGIAKLSNTDTGAGPTTRTGVVLGTPRYMAPEQCRGGGSLDHRADIYALGCLFYETLCGRPPFPYQWPGELIAAHLGEIPLPPRAWVPEIPPALDALVTRAIAKNPAHRPPTMSDIARELGVFLGLEASVPPIAIAESAPPQPSDGIAPIEATPRRALSGGATTTASAVIRPTPVDFAGSPFAPQPNVLDHGPPAPVRVETPEPKPTFTRPALARRTLVGAGAVVAAVAFIVVIAAKTKANRETERASGSEVLIGMAAPASSPELPSVPAAANGAVESPPAAENAASPWPAVSPPATDPAAAAPAGTVSAISTAPAAETPINTIRIKVANPRPGLRVAVDGRTAFLPLKLPRDQKSHALVFTAPNFKPETKTIVADQDHTLTLDYRPRLYVP